MVDSLSSGGVESQVKVTTLEVGEVATLAHQSG